jgi:hypothetical protein
MWFNFVMKNHGDTAAGDYLAPLTDYMRGALGRCGHETTVVRDEIYGGAINMFFEFFIEMPFVHHVLGLRKTHGLKIGVVATELMVGGSIPYGRHGILWNKDRKAIMLSHRMAGFDAFARGADFVWAWLERTAEEYRGVSPVSRFFPVGHVYAPPACVRGAPKDIDVLFYGTLTPHRAAVLASFRAAGIAVTCVGRGFDSGYKSKSYLDSLMDRAKIGLNLNLHAEDDTEGGVDPRFASCMRITEMLDRETCIVSEEIPLDNPYRGYMRSARPEELAQACRALLDSGAWREAGRAHAVAFRKEMDVERICRPVVDETLALIA